jgi:hypothetical protein
MLSSICWPFKPPKCKKARTCPIGTCTCFDTKCSTILDLIISRSQQFEKSKGTYLGSWQRMNMTYGCNFLMLIMLADELTGQCG